MNGNYCIGQEIEMPIPDRVSGIRKVLNTEIAVAKKYRHFGKVWRRVYRGIDHGVRRNMAIRKQGEISDQDIKWRR